MNLWKFLGIVNMVGMLLIISTFVLAMKDGNSCLSNPLIYGAKKIVTEGVQGTQGVTCQCSFKNSLYNPIVFNDENLSVISNFVNSGYSGGNFSLNLTSLPK